MAEIVLFGVGSTAQVLHYHLSREGHRVAAFTVDAAYCHDKVLMGTPVVSFETVRDLYPPTEFMMMIAIGYINVNQLRAERCAQAQKMGYHLFSYISPTAIVWDGLKVGENCKIGEQSLLQPFSRLGENVFIGSGCIIGHHTVIQDHCFLASGVKLGGFVQIEPYAFLGTGAVVRNKARVAARSVIGAGAVVLQDTHEGGVYLARAAESMGMDSALLSPG